MEIEWANAALDGKKVEIDIKLKYTGNAKRPDGFEVKYVIDGVPQTPRTIINQPGG